MSEPSATGSDIYEEETTAHSGGTATAVAEPPAGPLFEDFELTKFDDDDVEAGSAICKMLSLFFLYTVLAMAIVGYWTYSASLSG